MMNVEYLKSWIKAGLLFACLSLLFSCSNEEDVTPVQLKEVRFCLADNEQTRATQDNSFEVGDAIGVFAFVRDDNAQEATLEGEYANNKKWVWNGSQFLPETENDKIFFSGSKKMDFYVYYPYNKVANDPQFIIASCQQNQSSELSFNKSDFLTAVNKIGICNDIVTLNFKHRFSIVRLYVEDIGEEIYAYINPLELSVGFDFSSEIFTLGGTPKSVKMFNKGSKNGFITFDACVPTQNISGKVFTIQRADGHIDMKVADGILKEGEITTFGVGLMKTITIKNSTGGSTSGAGTYPYDYLLTVHAYPMGAYEFTGWTENGVIVSTNPDYTFKVTENRVLEPQFSSKSFLVSLLKSTQAAGEVTGAGYYAYGQSCTISASVNTGYTFSYWDDNGDVFSAAPTYTFFVTENKTLEAIYTTNVYTIDVVNGKLPTGNTSGKYLYGQEVTIVADTKPGKVFSKWTDGVTTPIRKITVTGNATYTAEFNTNQYTLTVVDGIGSGKYNYGTVVQIMPNEINGKTFVKWSDGVTTPTRRVTITGDATYTALFSSNLYRLTVINGTGSGDYEFGSNVLIAANSIDGKIFTGWSDGVTTSVRRIVVTRDATYTALFEANNYTIRVIPNVAGYGSTYGSGTYGSGSTVNIRAIPRVGNADITYSFINWSDGNTSADRNVVVTGNATYTANFQKVEYVYYLSVTPNNMTFSSSGGRKSFSVTSSKTKYVDGVSSGMAQVVNYTSSVSGSGFSLSGNSVVAGDNNSTNIRSGTVTIRQDGGKSVQISLEQEGKFNIDVDIQ